jgi:hypothetical protein
MALRKGKLLLKPALLTGAALAGLHSLLAVWMFINIYTERGIAQAEMAWTVFEWFDWPSVQLAFGWLAHTAPFRAIFEWGYKLVDSGPNLRAFALVGLAGGLQWFVIGTTLGACTSWIHKKVRSRSSAARA